MFHCHLTRRGRIILAEKLNADSLPDAVTIGHRFLKEMAYSQELDGLEIWEGMKLLYASAGQIYRSCPNGIHFQRDPTCR
jgi:hypothetical protein